MSTKVERLGSELQITRDHFGLILIYQTCSKNEHTKILNQLKQSSFHKPELDIFFEWKTMSVFMYDRQELSVKDRRKLQNISGKMKHGVILNGELLSDVSNLSSFSVFQVAEDNTVTVFNKQLEKLLVVAEADNATKDAANSDASPTDER
jgi:hypothetical protein